MSWSKNYTSREQMEQDTELPENATQEQLDAVKSAAKVLLDAGIIEELPVDEAHKVHPDNIDHEGKTISPQGRIRINLGGHSGRNPSVYVSIAGI